VVERHGKSGGVAHGLLRNFGLKDGAVASSVGHDAHNIILAGEQRPGHAAGPRRAEEDARGRVRRRGGKVVASVALPVAGLMSDKRATEVAAATTRLKRAWKAAGCKLPYMGFNLIPLSVIPDIRITDKGLVTVPGMKILPLFESSASAS
jgi:adenine deaminase